MNSSATSADGNLSVIWSAWRTSSLLQIVFSNGLIASLQLDKLGNIDRVSFDKVGYLHKLSTYLLCMTWQYFFTGRKILCFSNLLLFVCAFLVSCWPIAWLCYGYCIFWQINYRYVPWVPHHNSEFWKSFRIFDLSFFFQPDSIHQQYNNSKRRKFWKYCSMRTKNLCTRSVRTSRKKVMVTSKI